MDNQTQLRAKKRIEIAVPEAYKKVNEEVWGEIESYLFIGFVSSPATVAGHSFVFKSLNHNEVRNIEFMRPSRAAPTESRALFRQHFIAYSIFMIDGRNVLFERPRNIHRLIKIISKLLPAVQEKIIENLAALNTRAHRLHALSEIYAYENRSRYKWMQVQTVPIHSPMFTGIPGTDELGMNYAQQTWTALNKLQDKREEIETAWNNAKFIGSTMSKGVRAVDERDRARNEKERTEREDKKMKVLYSYLNRLEVGEDPPRKIQLPDGRMAVVEKKFHADSVEELADQLSSALSGEKDHHDLVVESHVKKLQLRSKRIDDQRRKMYASIPMPELPTTNEHIAGSRVIGGQADAEAHIARIQQLRLKQMEAARNVSLDLPEDPEQPPNR